MFKIIGTIPLSQ